MDNTILATIDAEISKLQQARALLANTPDALAGGRPKSLAKIAEPVKAKRVMTPETRAKMAEAQQARHAAKKQAAKKAKRLANKEALKPVEEMIIEDPVTE